VRRRRRRGGPTPVRVIGLVVAGASLAAIGALVTTSLTAGGGSPSSRYGGLPGYLPKSSTPVGVVVTATSSHPQLGVEGDTMKVVTSLGTVMASVVGPSVPQQGQFPVPSDSPCTFVVTLARATGDVTVDLGNFSVRDEQGHTHALSVAPGTPPPPSVVPVDGRSSFYLTAVLPTGAGELTWAPGGKPIASWDFDVELD